MLGSEALKSGLHAWSTIALAVIMNHIRMRAHACASCTCMQADEENQKGRIYIRSEHDAWALCACADMIVKMLKASRLSWGFARRYYQALMNSCG